MNILILGGNRFVGKRLANLLKSEGHRLTLLNRSGSGEADEFIKADRNSVKELKEVFKNRSYDLIYDFSCITPKDALSAIDLFENKTENYIVISSQSVYDSGKDLKEKKFDPYSYLIFTPEDENISYNEAKRQMESVFFRRSNLNAKAVRFPIILGEDDYTKRLHFHVDRIKNNEEIYFPNLEAQISFVNSKEASEFLLNLKEKEFSGPINFCSKDSISIAEVMTIIEEVINQKVRYAQKANDHNHSPFGIPSDWCMSSDLAESLGFEISHLNDWLPNLIKKIAD